MSDARRLPFNWAVAKPAGGGQAAPGQKPETGGHDLQSVRRALGQHIGIAALFSAAINLLYLAPSLYMMQVYDRVLVSGNLLTLMFLSLAILFALGTLSGLDAIRSRVMNRMSLRFDRKLAPVVMRAGLDARGEGRNDSDVTGMRDLDNVRQMIASPAATTLMDLPWTPLFIFVCFAIHLWIGIAALAGAALLFAMALLNEAASRRSLQLVAERAPVYYSALEGDMRSAEAARTLGIAGVLVERRLKERTSLLGAQLEAAFVSGNYTAGTKFLRLLLQSAMLGLGAYLAVQQEISPGSIIAGTILSARAFAPIEQIVGAWRQMTQAKFSLDNLRGLLAKVETRAPRTALPAPRGAVALEGLAGRAPGASRLTLQGVSFRAEPGEIVGVVGPSGAGKSTLARLLANALPPAMGAVRIDGASYADWEPEALARHIGYMPQSIDLMPGTIAENIARFAQPGADGLEGLSARVVAAAKAANAHDMILRLPGAYDSKLGPGGRGLSMGQAQRVALARALFGDPALLVLDEPNAHLDAEGEAALITALKSLKERGATAFVIAHRAGVMSVADRLIALQDGRILEAGPRDQVVAKLARAAGVQPATVEPRANTGERA